MNPILRPVCIRWWSWVPFPVGPIPGLKRGEIYVAAAKGPCTGKPRPVVIVQDDRFDATGSVTVCPFTTNLIEAPLVRLAVEANATTGIDQLSQIMVDKVTTVPRQSMRDRLGRLRDEDVVRPDRALLVFLGLAD